LHHPELFGLLEHLAAQAGAWGAFQALAEVDETSPAFEGLRAAGFSVYAWQRLWDVSRLGAAGRPPAWKRTGDADLPLVQGLYQQIIPPLLHPVEALPERAAGWIDLDEGRAFLSVRQGLYGIVLSPLIHPETSQVREKLIALISNFPDRRNRPMYVCVRSYQAWLEGALQDLGATAAPRQAVMVKHLTRMLKDEQALLAAQPARVSVQPSRISRLQKK
jgi:hypothetical protein